MLSGDHYYLFISQWAGFLPWYLGYNLQWYPPIWPESNLLGEIAKTNESVAKSSPLMDKKLSIPAESQF